MAFKDTEEKPRSLQKHGIFEPEANSQRDREKIIQAQGRAAVSRIYNTQLRLSSRTKICLENAMLEKLMLLAHRGPEAKSMPRLKEGSAASQGNLCASALIL